MAALKAWEAQMTRPLPWFPVAPEVTEARKAMEAAIMEEFSADPASLNRAVTARAEWIRAHQDEYSKDALQLWNEWLHGLGCSDGLVGRSLAKVDELTLESLLGAIKAGGNSTKVFELCRELRRQARMARRSCRTVPGGYPEAWRSLQSDGVRPRGMVPLVRERRSYRTECLLELSREKGHPLDAARGGGSLAGAPGQYDIHGHGHAARQVDEGGGKAVPRSRRREISALFRQVVRAVRQRRTTAHHDYRAQHSARIDVVRLNCQG